MCRNIIIKFISWAYMYTTLTFLGKSGERERERNKKVCSRLLTKCSGFGK